MRPTKRGPGRPPGERFPRRLPFYDDDEGMALLQEMARQDGCSAVDLMRRLIRSEAAARGVAPPVIVRDPARCGGDPILAGTRTAVHDVVSYSKLHGGDLEEVRAELPHLSSEQIQAALAYYTEHAAEIDEILRRRREFCERLPAAPTRE
jgi:uncharacterized protein (DUF433 family)